MEYKIKTHLQTLQKSIDGYDDNDDFNIVSRQIRKIFISSEFL